MSHSIFSTPLALLLFDHALDDLDDLDDLHGAGYNALLFSYILRAGH